MLTWKKIQRKIMPTEQDKKLDKWRDKLESARIAYSSVLDDINRHEKLYEGTRTVYTKDVEAPKEAVNVRNIVYELIESQVDPSVPVPKVTALHKEDEELAQKIEQILIDKMKKQKFHVMNDKIERIVPVQGGDFMLVEWDNTVGTHSSIGDVIVSERHPRQVIPQPGVTEIKKMDYIFVLTPQTKEFVKKKYGVDVSSASEDYRELRGESASTVEDIITINTVYYRNKGKIGRYVWCDDYVLEDLDDYQARMTRKCKKCGEVVDDDTKECPVCGSKSFEKTEDETQTIEIPKLEIEMVLDPLTGQFVEQQKMGTEEIEIECYKPNEFPIILRRNITRENSFLGYSDVEIIKDQQEMIKKLGSKAAEKTLKGGSIVTLPDSVKIETTDKELKIVRIDNPADKALIDVINVQANIQQDIQLMSLEYDYAKSVLGISDAYQGKYDSSALSGTAKQYSINQVAGRLESKRVLKNDSYASLYELMFKFWLAYADDATPITREGKDGEQIYEIMEKSDFLKQDANGEWYWNDEFIFETDPTSTLMANREAMWNQADIMLQSGAFGVLGDINTMLLYWKFKEKNNYPNAGEVLRQLELRKQEEQMQQAQMAQQLPPQEAPLEGQLPVPETPSLQGVM